MYMLAESRMVWELFAGVVVFNNASTSGRYDFYLYLRTPVHSESKALQMQLHPLWGTRALLVETVDPAVPV